MDKITVAIAEDHEVVRKGLVALLREYDQISILYDAANGEELISRMRRKQPQVLLLDIEMPVLNGIQVLDEIRVQFPEIKTIVVSAFYSKMLITESMKKGAKAFLSKNCKVDEIIHAIISVASNQNYFDKRTALVMTEQRRRRISTIIDNELEKSAVKKDKAELNERDLLIIKLIYANKTNKEIGNALQLSEKTIEAERSKIFRKTGTKSTVDLVKFVIKNKLIVNK